jgi:hypothetical protein
MKHFHTVVISSEQQAHINFHFLALIRFLRIRSSLFSCLINFKSLLSNAPSLKGLTESSNVPTAVRRRGSSSMVWIYIFNIRCFLLIEYLNYYRGTHKSNSIAEWHFCDPVLGKRQFLVIFNRCEFDFSKILASLYLALQVSNFYYYLDIRECKTNQLQ